MPDVEAALPAVSPSGPAVGVRRLAARLHGAQRELGILVVFAVVVGLAPAYGSAGTVALLTDGLLFLALCFAWNLVGGFLGELSLIHMIFWGIGAYGVMLAGNHGIPLVPMLVVYVALAALVGAFVAVLIRVAKLQGLLYVAIFTLVLGQIAIELVSNSKSLGGSEGLISTDVEILDATTLYLLLVVLVFAFGLINVVIARGRVGSRWLAIKDDSAAAATVGVNVQRGRLAAYALSAALCALAGAYQAYYAGYARPDVSLSDSFLILATLAVFAGGAGTALGPLAGAIVIDGLGDIARQFSTDVSISVYSQVVEFTVALLILRFVLPRVPHKDLISAAGSWLVRGAGRRRRAPAAAPADAPPAEPMDEQRILETFALTRGAGVARPAASVGDDAALVVRGVQKSFGAVSVLRDVSFSVKRGEVTGIVGPNGAGKSTLCNILSGLEPLSGGSITLDGADICAVRPHDRAAHGFGRAFQSPRLFESLGLVENLMLSPGVSREQALRTLAALGIDRPEERYGDDSDFFARRLVEVMRAATAGSDVLLLDEPLAGLTPDQRQTVLAIARQCAADGACVLIVEHLIPVLAPAVDKIVVLDGGRIIADGPPAQVLRDDAVVDAYLGTPMEVLP